MTQSSSDCSPGRLIRWMNTTADQPLFTAVIATTNCHYQSKGDFLTWNEFLYYPETNMTITAAKQQSPSNVIHSPSYFPLSLQQSLVNIKWTSNWQSSSSVTVALLPGDWEARDERSHVLWCVGLLQLVAREFHILHCESVSCSFVRRWMAEVEEEYLGGD